MKKVLYYAIVRVSYYGYRIIAVTSEKNHHVYGRYVANDEVTHTTSNNVKARFEQLELAQKAYDNVRAICSTTDDEIKILNEKMSAAYARQEDAIKQMLTDTL